MTFTPEITTGNLLTVIAFVVSVIGMFYGLKGKAEVMFALFEEHNKRVERMETRHEQRLTQLEQNHRTLTDVVQQLIGQDTERRRWDGLERRHGNEPRRR